MRKLILILCLISNTILYSQIYIASKCVISFYSHSPIEDITAINSDTKPLLNTATGDIQMKINMRLFRFKSPMMEEHFNENYVETERFPYAIYKGKINEPVDYTKDGETKVTVTGTFEIHGVKKERTLSGVVTVKDGQVIISSKFMIHIADYEIKVPSLYVTNIAEDVETKLDATLEPFKKN